MRFHGYLRDNLIRDAAAVLTLLIATTPAPAPAQVTTTGNIRVVVSGLVAENRNASDQEFSRFDTALTGGGPIITDHAWFFGSYRRLGSNGTVVALDGIDVIRTVEEQQDQFYARGTWAPSTNETLGFTFLNDPTEVSGSRDRDVTNARDSSRVQGGNNYHLKYARLFGDLLVEGSYSRHNGEVSDYAAVPGSRNSIVFRDIEVRTLADEQLGGFGLDDLDQRDTDGYKATAVVQAGRHALHGGFELMRNSNLRDTVFDGGVYTSLARSLVGLTAAELDPRPAPQRVVRPGGERPAADQRLLRQVLRSDPQQPDQLRRHPHRLDPRGAGLRQRPVGDLPDTRRAAAGRRAVRADDEDTLDRRLPGELGERPRRRPQRHGAVHEAADAGHHRGLRHGPLHVPNGRDDQLSGARPAISRAR